MFRSVRIQNFRQFKDLTLENLGRINLITGQNNTGKTSLLEALWLLTAGPVDPGVVQSVARLRGIDQVGIEGPSSWGWIFRDHRQEDGIVLKGTGADGGTEILRILQSNALSKGAPVPIGAPAQPHPQTVSTADISAQSLRLAFTDAGGVTHESSLDIIGRDAIPHGSYDVAPRRWYFLSNRQGDPGDEAQNFDRLVLSGAEQQLLDAYRTIDSRVNHVRTLNPGTGQRVYASLEDDSFLPVDVMGHGFYRMGKIATAILMASGGVALIDEIDDGLHYSVLKDVWRIVIGLADRYDVQIFATTHSLECVNAAAEVAEGQEAELVLHRLSRRDRQIRATLVEDEGIRAAVGFGFELR